MPARIGEATSESDIKKMVILYVEHKKSIPQIAEEMNVPKSRVRLKLISNGVTLRSKKEALSLIRHLLGKHAIGKKRTFTQEHKDKISKAHLAIGEKTARGFSVKPNGYIEYTRGEHKSRSEHVVKMEKRIGRKILADEVVHHIDGNKTNNDINNLALMTRSAHARLHRRERRLLKGDKQ